MTRFALSRLRLGPAIDRHRSRPCAAPVAEVNRDEAALQQASTLRMKEKKEFHADEAGSPPRVWRTGVPARASPASSAKKMACKLPRLARRRPTLGAIGSNQIGKLCCMFVSCVTCLQAAHVIRGGQGLRRRCVLLRCPCYFNGGVPSVVSAWSTDFPDVPAVSRLWPCWWRRRCLSLCSRFLFEQVNQKYACFLHVLGKTATCETGSQGFGRKPIPPA